MLAGFNSQSGSNGIGSNGIGSNGIGSNGLGSNGLGSKDSSQKINFGAGGSGGDFAKDSVLSSGVKPSVSDMKSNTALKELLDSAHNLPKINHANIGPIHLTLNELQKETEQLRQKEQSRSRRGESNGFTRAHYLLSGSGINASDFENELLVLPSLEDHEYAGRDNLAAFGASANPADVENYLTAKKEESILNAIELSLVSASKDFDRFISLNISIDWKIRKDDLKKRLGIPIASKISSDDLAKSFAWNKSLPGNYHILSSLSDNKQITRHVNRDKFESCAKITYSLNESRLQGKPFLICLSLEDLSKSSSDFKSKQMADIWRHLADFTNEKSATVSQEQAFYDPNESPASGALKKRIVQTAKGALEQQFFNYLDEIYTKDDKKPAQFSQPKNVNKVLYFIDKVIKKNHDSNIFERTLCFNGTHVWVLIFYLMRSGLYKEAVEFCRCNENAFNKFDRNFPAYLSHYKTSNCLGLPSDLQERITSDFTQNFQYMDENLPLFDPYKYAVYKIIAKCDLAKKTLPMPLNLSMEDWLWFHLLIINEFLQDNASNLLFENYRLENLQAKVVSLGPSRFNASSNNPLYAKTLVLLGLHELAVKYVYENISECDAVHLAISLCYYGLLKTSSANTDDVLVVGSAETLELNYSRLLGSYTRTFKISDPKVAAQYLILICMSRGGKSVVENEKCHEAIRELILVSREFKLLLGDLNEHNGEKTPGILEKQRALFNLSNLRQFYMHITELSARRCEEEGRVFDALLLYQLCQEYNTVVALINKFLSELLSVTELDRPLISEESSSGAEAKASVENNFILLSKHTMEVFNNNTHISGKISPKESEIARYLLPMIDIRQSFVLRDWRGTLDAVKKLELVPIVDKDDFLTVRTAAEALNNCDVRLVKVIPSLLTIVMTCVSQMHYSIVVKKYGADDQQRVELDKLRNIAKNCMVYAGMIQYRMPRETFSLLVKLESELQ